MKVRDVDPKVAEYKAMLLKEKILDFFTETSWYDKSMILNFYLMNLISHSQPLTLRLRSYEKSRGALNYWGQNLLISSVQKKSFLMGHPHFFLTLQKR